jgi:hypothetical protein
VTKLACLGGAVIGLYWLMSLTGGPAPAQDQAPSPEAAPDTAAVRFGTPVPGIPGAARLGAPQGVSVTTATPAEALAQYVPPLRQRDAEEGTFVSQYLPGTIQLTLPGPQRLFRLDSEAAVLERLRQEARERNTPDIYEFPEEQKDVRPAKLERYSTARYWPVTKELVEPGYVWHSRVPFEEINTERYGWTTGVLQPLLSAAHFYADVATLPYHLAQDPCRHGDTSAGKCLPGDPVPLLLYPPELSWSGLVAEAAAVTLVFVAFP